MKLGSLFDGSGGFPLAGSICGIEPVWAAEVEPYPIAVTTSRFPKMRHLGSVTDIDGAKVEPVDIITFGSPCQDLSVAGKRAGLKHEANGDEETTRSGLFMEAVRIIREMREATNGRYPAFALWENVPGAFSSNKGEDFRTVLEELVKIVEPSAVMPPVPKNGWPYADCYHGEGWSIGYRTFDAQYWGVPQRRRRIHLVLHLTGQCAGSVLFEREGLRGHFAESGTAWKRTAGYAEDCTGAADCAGEGTGGDRGRGLNIITASGFNYLQGSKARGIGFEREKAGTLRAGQFGDAALIIGAADCEGAVGLDIYNLAVTGDVATTLTTATGQGASNTGPSVAVPYTLKIRSGCEGGGNVPMVMETITIHDKATRYQGGGPTRNGDGAGNGLGVGQPDDPCPTLSTCDRHMVAYSIGNGQLNQISMSETCNTLDCMHDKQAVVVFDKEVYNSGENSTGGHYIVEDGPAPSLRTEHPPGVCTQYIVRRLTPTECARLQGFPDNWGHPVWKEELTEQEYAFWLNVRNTHAAINGKPVKEYTKDQMLAWYNKLHTDSAEYKMWGNGIALPPALYVMEGIAETERMKT